MPNQKFNWLKNSIPQLKQLNAGFKVKFWANLKETIRKHHRAILILLIGIGDLLFVWNIYYLGWWEVDFFQQIKEWTKQDPRAFTAIMPLLFSPILFTLWFYRDQNQQQTIDNQRKDTNLKDFQQLQQWATGNFSYVDVLDQKLPNLKLDDDWEEKRLSEIEENRLTLQTSALHQLRPFLKGEYGDNFKRATYEIYAALLKQTHNHILKKLTIPAHFNNNYNFRTQLENEIKKNRLAYSLKRIVQEDKEWFFNQDFPYQGISLLGMNLSGFEFKQINGKAVNFQQADFRGADLSKAHLQGANLSGRI